MAIVGRHVAAGSPITLIVWGEPFWSSDSGFLIVSDDDPDAEVATAEDITPVCFDCLLGEHSGIGAALEEARETGIWTAA